MKDKSEARNQRSEGSQKSERRTKGCRNVCIAKHLRYFAGLLPETCDDRDMARKSEAQPGSGAAFTPLHGPPISAYSGYSAVKNLIREIPAICGRLRICGEMRVPVFVLVCIGPPLATGLAKAFGVCRPKIED